MRKICRPLRTWRWKGTTSQGMETVESRTWRGVGEDSSSKTSRENSLLKPWFLVYWGTFWTNCLQHCKMIIVCFTIWAGGDPLEQQWEMTIVALKVCLPEHPAWALVHSLHLCSSGCSEVLFPPLPNYFHAHWKSNPHLDQSLSRTLIYRNWPLQNQVASTELKGKLEGRRRGQVFKHLFFREITRLESFAQLKERISNRRP